MADVSQNVNIPVIASGGLGQVSDLGQISHVANISAVACAHVLHYEKFQIKEIKGTGSSWKGGKNMKK